jgi:adenine-specific DNA methylase
MARASSSWNSSDNAWASFFNDRQLYCLGRIAAALRDLPGRGPEREALAASFGKTLEHHNVFCSYKGEGTGPIRSIFHNHVLRPERCSLEGNPWGAHGGSGGFADVLHRLQRAHEYKSQPTDLTEVASAPTTMTGRSCEINRTIARSWQAFAEAPDAAYIVTGDAAATDLPDRSVALVVTDPPYVDNVHYSELADFFHVWMRTIRPYAGYARSSSTRDAREVQNRRAGGFREMITGVWRECARVLRDDGLLAFSFHQSETSGWAALMASLADAGFVVTATRPVVAEVTTSLSKIPAVAPNRIDVIVVCRKANTPQMGTKPPMTPAVARRQALASLRRMQDDGLALGEGDVRSAVRAAVLAVGTRNPGPVWETLAATADDEAERAVAQSAPPAAKSYASAARRPHYAQAPSVSCAGGGPGARVQDGSADA